MITRASAFAAIRELRRRKAASRNFCPHEPRPKQQAFVDLDCLEALYGGAAGGGKTDALLMAAARFVGTPGYAALLLRRTYQDLAKDEAIMTRAKAWWCGQGGIAWSEKDKRFTFPSGATIAFGYLDNDRDKYNYQGGAWQFIGFDELTQFPAPWYMYLLTRLRKLAGSEVPLRVRSASNPGGIGHDWVLRRFVDPRTREGEFIPANLDDNPYLDRESYRVSLSLVDPTLRKQLAEGIWIRDGAGLVYAHYLEALSDVDLAPECETTIIALDFGVSDENAIAVVGWREHDPNVYILECYRKKGIVDDMAREVRALEETYSPAMIVGDTGGMGKLFAEELIQRHGIPVQPAEKSNKLGYISLMNSDLALGRVKVVRRKCKDLVGEWVELPWAESRLKEAEGFNNHASDAALYGWRASLAYHERPEPPKQRANRPSSRQEDSLLRAALDSLDSLDPTE